MWAYSMWSALHNSSLDGINNVHHASLLSIIDEASFHEEIYKTSSCTYWQSSCLFLFKLLVCFQLLNHVTVRHHLEDIVYVEIGKMIANVHMMRFYIFLHGSSVMQNRESWLTTLISSRLALCNAFHMCPYCFLWDFVINLVNTFLSNVFPGDCSIHANNHWFTCQSVLCCSGKIFTCVHIVLFGILSLI